MYQPRTQVQLLDDRAEEARDLELSLTRLHSLVERLAAYSPSSVRPSRVYRLKMARQAAERVENTILTLLKEGA